ncbi:MAG TPA: hypothetical protein VF329_05085 [Gammaproteobacteria bacterium]
MNEFVIAELIGGSLLPAIVAVAYWRVARRRKPGPAWTAALVLAMLFWATSVHLTLAR